MYLLFCPAASNPPPLLQAPPQHPPPLLETGIPPPGSQPPPMYGYGPEHMEQYPDPMGQYPDYGDYPGGPPPEMGLPEEPYPPYDGKKDLSDFNTVKIPN